MGLTQLVTHGETDSHNRVLIYVPPMAGGDLASGTRLGKQQEQLLLLLLLLQGGYQLEWDAK